jgi:BirA family biotin operon repressor/biotin-[acetyl-CoA-carboxylase] ligase
MTNNKNNAYPSIIDGVSIIHLDECASTMTEARTLLADNQPPFIVVAEHQTQGHGRVASRPWASPPGENLLFTYCFPIGGYENIPPCLSLRAGLALARAVQETAPELAESVKGKWPNDLYLNGKKASGILTESDGRNVYLGMGLNCNQRTFEDGKRTSIRAELERPVNRAALLQTLLFYLHEDILQREVPWLAMLNALLFKKGDTVNFAPGGPDTKETVSGELVGINENGAIVLRAAPGLESAYITGELRL